MPGISDLVNSISASIDGLVDDFKGNKNTPVHYHYGDGNFYAIQSQVNPANWNKLTFPYTFSVVNIIDSSQDAGFDDFALPLAPQSIKQKEVPAVSRKPSQGGTTVTHSGTGYYQLNISGTTGIAAFRGDGGVNAKTGEAIFQPKDLKHKSGYEVFLHLRNWLRTYYQWKKTQGKAGKDFRLVFKNYKDGEFLIVELDSFEMERQAARSFLYDYNIEFTVLAHYEFSTPTSKTDFLSNVDSVIDNALDKINLAKGIFLRTQGILRQVEATYDATVLDPMRQATLAMKALLGIPLVAADIASRTIVDTVSTASALALTAQQVLNTATLGATGKSQTLADINSLLDTRLFGTSNTLQKTLAATTTAIQQNGSAGLATMGGLLMTIDAGSFPAKTLTDTINEQNASADLPRSFYQDTVTNLERVKQNAEDFFNLGSTTYDTIFDRTATLNADVSKVVTSDEYDILFGFNEAITGLNLLMSTDALFKSTLDDRITDMNNRFNNTIALQASQAVKQIKLTKGLSLERLAQQQLGDSTRWGEIAEVNNLKAPFISEDPMESRDGVLGPGMNILIPQATVNGFSQVPSGTDNVLTAGMTELEKSLGCDLKVNKDFDLVLTSSGDLQLVAGADNMAQATILKLSYEPGDVMLYPQLGAGLIIGSKFPDLNDIADNVTRTLLQDSRVSSISGLTLRRESSGLTLSFLLYIKNVDIPVPVKIKV